MDPVGPETEEVHQVHRSHSPRTITGESQNGCKMQDEKSRTAGDRLYLLWEEVGKSGGSVVGQFTSTEKIPCKPS